MGRKKEALRQDVGAGLHGAGERSITAGRADATARRMMRADCLQHYRFITIKAAHANRKALHCPFCSKDGQTSKHALLAAGVLSRCAQGWANECRVLGKEYGPMDFYFPGLGLGVEVDGEQHFEGEGAALQQWRDARKNVACWQQGLAVLRVHHADTRLFEGHLWVAATERTQHPSQAFIMYTPAYKTPDLLQRRGDAPPPLWLQPTDATHQVRLLDVGSFQP